MTLEIHKSQVLDELRNRVGRDNGIHVRDLVARITNQLINGEALERRVRDLVQELRREGHRICAYPATGYFIAADNKERDETCLFLLERCATSTDQVAALMGQPAPDLYQLFGLTRPAKKD